MAKGKKTGGGLRTGSRDKRKEAFRVRLQAYCVDKDVDPHLYMVDLIADPLLEDRSLKFQAAKELAQYLEPKLRAVEVSGNPDQPLHHSVVIQTLSEALARAYPHRS
jgi:hypothetical protein